MPVTDFDAFVKRHEPSLRRALSGHLAPSEVGDAVGEAFLHAWENKDRVMAMDNPAGFLYRVAQSKRRRRKQGFLPWSADAGVPDYEPGLVGALEALPPKQARAVWLVIGCGFTHREAGVAMQIRPSTVATHVRRGLDALRASLGVSIHG